MTIDPNVADRSLKSKGFIVDEGKHKNYYFIYNGINTMIKTHISHNSGDLTEYLIGEMRKQLHLETKKQAIDLLKCPLSLECYIKILLRNPDIRDRLERALND